MNIEHLTVCCRHGMLLLKADEHKQIILKSLAFLVKEQRIWLYGFVILEDEIHLLWKKQPAWESRNIRQMLLKFTAQRIKYCMQNSKIPEVQKELLRYKSPQHDRHFHFWEPHAASCPVITGMAAEEILQHMHEAPLLSGLCLPGTVYPYSSAAFYQAGEDPLQMVTHYQQYFPP